MFKSIQKLFSKNALSSKAEPSEQDLKLAAATLMFEMVKADGEVDSVELTTMLQSLKQQFDIADDDFTELLTSAKKTADDAVSLQGFTRQICENWDNEQRVKLLEHLWMIALADDIIDAHERHLVRKIAGLLYLTDKQIIVAKEKAKSRQTNK